MTMHSILIEVVEEETPDMLLCTVAGKSVWIPKSALRSCGMAQLGECNVGAHIPLDLARQLGIVPVELPIYQIQQCRTCGAQIFWARTVNNKSTPIDAEPVEFGGNVVLRDGVAVVLKKGEPTGADEKRYRSHFATCVTAAQHRKPASTDAAKTKAGKRQSQEPSPSQVVTRQEYLDERGRFAEKMFTELVEEVRMKYDTKEWLARCRAKTLAPDLQEEFDSEAARLEFDMGLEREAAEVQAVKTVFDKHNVL